jgi:hypothetical protein
MCAILSREGYQQMDSVIVPIRMDRLAHVSTPVRLGTGYRVCVVLSCY